MYRFGSFIVRRQYVRAVEQEAACWRYWRSQKACRETKEFQIKQLYSSSRMSHGHRREFNRVLIGFWTFLRLIGYQTGIRCRSIYYYIFKTGWRLWPPTRVIHMNLRQKVHSNEVASGLEVWVFCDFVKFWPLGWKSGVFCDFVGFWPLKKCLICFLAPTLFDTVGFEVAPKGRPGGIRASDLQAPSPNCLVVHPLDLPKIPKSKIQNPQNPQNPKSKIPKIPKSKIPKIPKIQNPKSPKSQNPKSKIPKIPKIQNPKSPKSQNPKSPKSPKSKIPKIPKSKIQNPQNPKSKIQNPQNPKSKLFWPDFGDFGFWILDRYVAILYVRPPTPQILDFGGGFWILDFGDFGFWILGILDFGFWILGILDFGFWGFWILDFGFWGVWILDFGAGIPNPKSKIQNPQNPKSKIPKIPKILPKKLGFWSLGILEFWILDFGDFGFWIFGILGFWILDCGDFGFWFLDFGDFGFWILGILDFGFWGFWILDFRDFGDFGFWIFGTLCSRSLCAKFGFWNLGILDFGFWGFWILDFGFWGFWILDFGDLGFWILDWGFWMGTLWQNFGCYIRKEAVHADPGRRII